MVEKNNKPGTEMHTFLSNNDVKDELTTKYKVQVIPTDKDPESALTLTEQGKFDPFTERNLEHPTSDGETLTHLLKASLGTGILSMPLAFKSSGLILGIFMTILVSLICTHCSYILVKCAHVLYYKTRKCQMSYAEVMEASLTLGPKPFRKFAAASKQFVQWSLFLTYFLTCSAYAVIIASGFSEVVNYQLYNYTNMTGAERGDCEHGTECFHQQIIVLILMAFLVALMAVPNLKKLAPLSMLANVFMGLSLGITFYYIAKNIDSTSVNNIKYIGDFSGMSTFFGLTIFALEAIGVMMPLENSMKTPQHFVGICGVLNQGMSAVTLIYIVLGFLGYLAYPGDIKAVITANLDVTDPLAQATKIMISLAVYLTFGLQFFVCLDIAWSQLKDHCKKRPMLCNYGLRIIMVIVCVALAAVTPIKVLLGFIGAVCFSLLGLLVPAILETITYWDVGFGQFHWVAIKNVFVVVFSLIALISGLMGAIADAKSA